MSDEYGESIAWKFKSNIDETGLPNGSVVTNDWYDGKRFTFYCIVVFRKTKLRF